MDPYSRNPLEYRHTYKSLRLVTVIFPSIIEGNCLLLLSASQAPHVNQLLRTEHLTLTLDTNLALHSTGCPSLARVKVNLHQTMPKIRFLGHGSDKNGQTDRRMLPTALCPDFVTLFGQY